MRSTAVMFKLPNLAVLSGCNDLNYYLCSDKVTTTGVIMPFLLVWLQYTLQKKKKTNNKKPRYTLGIYQICATPQSDCYHLENDSQPKEYSELT